MSTKVAASFLAFIMLSFPSEASSKQSKMDRRIAAVKALDADTVLKRVEKRMYASNESAKVIMKTYERNGAAKTREMIVKRKSQKKNKKILVRLLNPGDLRGTGLLSMEKSGKKDQWIYLPSSKKTRRILSRNQGGGFMGSELSYEDMGGMIGVEFKNRTLKEEKIKKQNYIVIESIPFKGQSTYKMIHTWVSAKNDVITQAKYYDKKGKLLKIASFFKYKKFGKIYRAQKLQVKNVQNGRSTVMLLQGLEIKKKIDDDEFTVAALEDD